MSRKILNPRRSKMHLAVKALLVSLYPGFRIEEEKRIETSEGDLPIDLVVPQMMLCVECHGVQHFQYTAHFHRTVDDYTAQRTRDAAKKNAIKRAGYAFLVIRHDEYEKLTTKQLAKRILKALTENK